MLLSISSQYALELKQQLKASAFKQGKITMSNQTNHLFRGRIQPQVKNLRIPTAKQPIKVSGGTSLAARLRQAKAAVRKAKSAVSSAASSVVMSAKRASVSTAGRKVRAGIRAAKAATRQGKRNLRSMANSAKVTYGLTTDFEKNYNSKAYRKSLTHIHAGWSKGNKGGLVNPAISGPLTRDQKLSNAKRVTPLRVGMFAAGMGGVYAGLAVRAGKATASGAKSAAKAVKTKGAAGAISQGYSNTQISANRLINKLTGSKTSALKKRKLASAAVGKRKEKVANRVKSVASAVGKKMKSSGMAGWSQKRIAAMKKLWAGNKKSSSNKPHPRTAAHQKRRGATNTKTSTSNKVHPRTAAHNRRKAAHRSRSK
jgi:hypothetical protein